MIYLLSYDFWMHFIHNRIVPDVITFEQRTKCSIHELDELIDEYFRENTEFRYLRVDLGDSEIHHARHFAFKNQADRLKFVLMYGEYLGAYDTYDTPELWMKADPAKGQGHRHIVSK